MQLDQVKIMDVTWDTLGSKLLKRGLLSHIKKMGAENQICCLLEDGR